MNFPGIDERATLRFTRMSASPIGVTPSQNARSEACTLDIMIEAGRPLARDVGDRDAEAVLVEREEVEVIAAHVTGRNHLAVHFPGTHGPASAPAPAASGWREPD